MTACRRLREGLSSWTLPLTPAVLTVATCDTPPVVVTRFGYGRGVDICYEWLLTTLRAIQRTSVPTVGACRPRRARAIVQFVADHSHAAAEDPQLGAELFAGLVAESLTMHEIGGFPIGDRSENCSGHFPY